MLLGGIDEHDHRAHLGVRRCAAKLAARRQNRYARLMRWCLLVLVGCGGGDLASDAAMPDALAPDVNGFDLEISSSYVRVFVHFTAAALDGISVPHLPDIGTCAALETDTAVAVDSTLRGVAIDGLALTNDDPYPDMQVSSPYTSYIGVTTDTVFRANDANISIEVPIHAGGYLAATDVQALQQGTDVLASWTAPTADSVLVGYGGGFGAFSCHRPASSQFLLLDAGGEIDVQPLAAPEVTETPLGTVRVFYGEVSSVQVTP
jgi:hypothetical protein